MINLHVHSTWSDGTLDPQGVVEAAVAAGVSGLSLTDHDTLGGTDEARAAAERSGIRFASGVEIDCVDSPTGARPEILGYGVSLGVTELSTLLDDVQADRRRRNEHFLDQLGERYPRVTLSIDELHPDPERVVLKPMLARYLVRKGIVQRVGEGLALLRRLDDSRSATPEAVEAIGAVRRAGGVAVLAHPWLIFRDDWAALGRFVHRLVDEGLGGVETWYPYSTRVRGPRDDFPAGGENEIIGRVRELARSSGVLATAGFDDHGSSVRGWDVEWMLPGANDADRSE